MADLENSESSLSLTIQKTTKWAACRLVFIRTDPEESACFSCTTTKETATGWCNVTSLVFLASKQVTYWWLLPIYFSCNIYILLNNALFFFVKCINKHFPLPKGRTSKKQGSVLAGRPNHYGVPQHKKKRMLELFKENSKHNNENIEQTNQNISYISSTIQDGFVLMWKLVMKQTPHSHNFEQYKGHWFSLSPVETSSPSPTYLHTPHTINQTAVFSTLHTNKPWRFRTTTTELFTPQNVAAGWRWQLTAGWIRYLF